MSGLTKEMAKRYLEQNPEAKEALEIQDKEDLYKLKNKLTSEKNKLKSSSPALYSWCYGRKGIISKIAKKLLVPEDIKEIEEEIKEFAPRQERLNYIFDYDTRAAARIIAPALNFRRIFGDKAQQTLKELFGDEVSKVVDTFRVVFLDIIIDLGIAVLEEQFFYDDTFFAGIQLEEERIYVDVCQNLTFDEDEEGKVKVRPTLLGIYNVGKGAYQFIRLAIDRGVNLSGIPPQQKRIELLESNPNTKDLLQLLSDISKTPIKDLDLKLGGIHNKILTLYFSDLKMAEYLENEYDADTDWEINSPIASHFIQIGHASGVDMMRRGNISSSYLSLSKGERMKLSYNYVVKGY